MPNTVIGNFVRDKHSSDLSQLAVIESKSSRLFVEAPAGFGKTSTMTSKAMELLVDGSIPYPKRILCLTFSVNAAQSMRASVDSMLKELPCDRTTRQKLASRISVHNYHGLCRKVLQTHGHLVFGSNVELSCLRMIDTKDAGQQQFNGAALLSDKELESLKAFDRAIANRKTSIAREVCSECARISCEKLVPNGRLTHNGLLALTINLLDTHPSVAAHLQSLYKCLLVDEAQDMNILFLSLLCRIVSDNTKVLLFGDTVQRIYGFLGAISDMAYCSKKTFEANCLTLQQNHRFSADSDIGLLERAVRSCSTGEEPSKKASANLLVSSNPFEEAQRVADAIEAFEASSSVAVLYRSRNFAELLVEELSQRGVDFFDGTFNDEDAEYIAFNHAALEELQIVANPENKLTRRQAQTLIKTLSNFADERRYLKGQTYKSLILALGNQLEGEYKLIDSQDRYNLVWRIFSEKALKSVMGYISERVLVLTVHAAKGLEWDHVIVPSMYQFGFPAPAYCYQCAVKKNVGGLRVGSGCNSSGKVKPSGFDEEQSAFYVAVTRARKSILFSTSQLRIDKNGNFQQTGLSCLLQSENIRLVSV